jgi:hypothetical protein
VKQVYFFLTYQKLTLCIDPRDQRPENLSFWGLEAVVFQIQPIELLELSKSLRAVDINLFASLRDKLGNEEASKIALNFYHTKMEVTKDHATDLCIIGNQLDALQRCLMTFGMSLDTLFRFKDGIRLAIRDVIERYITFVRPRQFGSHNDVSGSMFQLIAIDFQMQIDRVFMQVCGNHIDTAEAMVMALNRIPDVGPDSTLSTQFIALKIQHHTVTPPHKGDGKTGKQTRRDAQRERSAARQEKNTSVNSVSPTSQPSPHTDKYLCAFYLSDKGCSRSPCDRDHRLPTSPEDKESVKKFFQIRKKTHTQVLGN